MEIPVTGMETHYFGPGDPCIISSMCSVFAESEVINLINDGVAMPPIVKGLLQSLANRVASIARRLGVEEAVAMTGGVAKNRGVRDALERKLGVALRTFDGQDPQLVGALGAALVAADLTRGGAEA
jgi:activator of 2-hydroxyglutaryl-CoA dehydratase